MSLPLKHRAFHRSALSSAAINIAAMPEIITFPQRMRFQAIRSFDARTGAGGVVAILWAPVHSQRKSGNHRQKDHHHPALADLLPDADKAVALVAAHPAVASYGND